MDLGVLLSPPRSFSILPNKFIGVPLHISHQKLVPLLDTYTSTLPEYIAPVVVSSSLHLIPSSRFTGSRYPPSLLRHLLTLSPPYQSPPATIHQAADLTKKVLSAAEDDSISEPEPSKAQPSTGVNPNSSKFLGMSSVKVPMPDMHLNVAMDIRKWSWPGALSFGKGLGNKSPQVQQPAAGSATEEKTETEQHVSDPRSRSVDVDTNSLQDAMESDPRSVSASPDKIHGSSDGEFKQIEGLPNIVDSEPSFEHNSAEIDQEEYSPTSVAEVTPTASQMIVPPATTDSPRPSLESLSVEEPLPELLSSIIHLPREAGLATETISTKIMYFKVTVDCSIHISSCNLNQSDLDTRLDYGIYR